MKVMDLLHEAEQLSSAEKWWLVKHLLNTLENPQFIADVQTDWHEFLRQTYGSTQDSPLERWDQGEYEEREPLE